MKILPVLGLLGGIGVFAEVDGGEFGQQGLAGDVAGKAVRGRAGTCSPWGCRTRPWKSASRRSRPTRSASLRAPGAVAGPGSSSWYRRRPCRPRRGCNRPGWDRAVLSPSNISLPAARSRCQRSLLWSQPWRPSLRGSASTALLKKFMPAIHITTRGMVAVVAHPHGGPLQGPLPVLLPDELIARIHHVLVGVEDILRHQVSLVIGVVEIRAPSRRHRRGYPRSDVRISQKFSPTCGRFP